MTIILSPNEIDRCVELLMAGEVIGVPTDTVYGVAASIDHPQAIERIYSIKGRPADKPIPILVSDIATAEALATHFPTSGRRLAKAFWPGGLTIIVAAAHRIPKEALAGGETVGIRIPDHDLMLDLIRRSGGALAVTSANISGQPEALSAEETRDFLIDRIPAVLDGGRAPGGNPSTVVNVLGKQLKVVRQGHISEQQIKASLQESADG